MTTALDSIVLRLPRGVSDVVNRKTILRSLFYLNKENFSKIEYVSQQFNNFTWRITFYNDFDASGYVGEKVSVSGVDVELTMSIRTTMTITSSDILLTKCFGFLINSIWQKLKNSLKETLSQ